MRYVLYHANCYDGFGSAFAAWKKFGYENTTYIPVTHNQPAPETPNAQAIYILDFAYSAREIYTWLDNGIPVILLDHHKTAKESLDSLMGSHSHLHIVFNLEKSGALISWNYFHPSTEVPELIKHISDRDLWQFKYPDTEKVHNGLLSLERTFEVWDSINIEELKLKGGACTSFYNKLISDICNASYLGKIYGQYVPMVNTSLGWSDVGSKMLEKYPNYSYVACFTVQEEQVMWSLRSKKDFDVSEIAKKFGGGGHKNAAGFKTTKL